uniref:Uncharacterized protein n=1 Tax=Tanacetum cinerariifolium TaxID=118510 RepID=A0A6L2JB22_TANCI|nr:hypothetical protein [Tanacetum cinerariifolium]
MMRESKSYDKHPKHKSLYDALVQSLLVDEDDMNQGVVKPPTQKKRRHDDDGQDPLLDFEKEQKRRKRKDAKPSKKSSTSKESSKDHLDWKNPNGDICPYDSRKPLPLQCSLSQLTIHVDFFFNNDLEYLKTRNSKRKYTASTTKTKAARLSRHDVYLIIKILSVVSVKVDKQYGYGYSDEIVTKLFNLDGEDIVDLAVTLRMFTRRIIIQKRVENVQLGVESYQKKLNITKPQKEFPGISYKEAYTTSYHPKGVIYLDSSKRKRMMRADELYKFSDKTLNQNRMDLPRDIPIVRLEVLSIHSDDENPSSANIKQAMP